MTHIDKEHDVFGDLYRVWLGSQFLGSFYQNGNQWIARTAHSQEPITCETYEQAASTIKQKMLGPSTAVPSTCFKSVKQLCHTNVPT